MAQYGDRVVVVDEGHPHYCRIGAVTGKNSGNLGIRFENDPNPPATGNWVPKNKVRLFTELKQAIAPLPSPPHLQRVQIVNARVIQDKTIDLISESTRHLILTGPNGCGKSTVLCGLADALRCDHGVPGDGLAADVVLELAYSSPRHEVRAHADGNPPLIVNIFPTRRWEVPEVSGPKEIPWEKLSGRRDVSSYWAQHLVNQRTALSFAREDGAHVAARRLESWLDKVKRRLAKLFDRPDLTLSFQRDTFRYVIEMDGRPVPLECLPDGFSSLLSIWAEVLLREESHRQMYGSLPDYGYVIIDEIESHLHLALQEQVLGLLTDWHPNYQFLVASHAPAVLTSISDAVVVGLGTGKVERSGELLGIPYGDLMTGHFGLSSDMDIETTALRARFYQALREHRRADAEQLGAKLSLRSATLSVEVWRLLQKASA